MYQPNPSQEDSGTPVRNYVAAIIGCCFGTCCLLDVQDDSRLARQTLLGTRSPLRPTSQPSSNSLDGVPQHRNEQHAPLMKGQTSSSLAENIHQPVRARKRLAMSPEKSSTSTVSEEPESRLYDSEEDQCPTCLESYSSDNPKIETKCGHHYHLPCILGWMERSNGCPMCGRTLETLEDLQL